MIVTRKNYYVFSGLISIGVLIFIAYTSLWSKSFWSEPLMLSSIASQNWASSSNKEYKSACLSLYKKLRFPDPSLYYNPPIRKLPPSLLDEFTQHGKMPIKKWTYLNTAYSDSKGDEKTDGKIRVISQNQINDLVKKVKNNEPLGYRNKVRLKLLLFSY